MDAVSALVTVPPTPPPPLVSSAITPEVAVATNRPSSANATIHHVNQSNNNIHHSGTNSLGTTASAVAAVAAASNVGSHSSNSSSHSSCSSSSSNSSGYGSTTTTPTNNYDFQQQQQQTTPTTTPIPTTPIAIAEPIIPVATVAAVTPFYNESIATHNLEQQQLQQQQHSHHLLQQQHHQLSQTHVQTNTHQHQHQHQPQYLPRQQYYPTYTDYQQSPPPTHNLTGSASQSALAYNMGIPGPYELSSSAATSYAVGSQYKTPGMATLNYERNATVRTTPYNQPQQTSNEIQNKPLAQHHSQQFSGALSSSKQRTSSLIGSSSSVSTSKPQAAATPFYAQPLAQSHTNPTNPYYDNVKHKMPLEYHDSYGNNTPSAANTYHQQQKYYAAAKSQLKEAAAYGSPAVGLSGKSLYSSTSNFFPASASTYDKYLYPPHVPATGYSTSQHVGSETPPDQNNYRKPVAANQLNSSSWPWGIDYNAGNSRTIPPPPTNHIPTATVAPTHATYLAPNPTSLARESFYMGPDKYGLKYDKYAVPPAYQQTYVNPTSSRHHMWPSSASANNLSPLNERHPTVPPPHGLHNSPYFPANSASTLNSRQSCCNQPYQTQNCYYPAPTHTAVNRLPYNQPAAVAPPSGGYLTSQQPPLGQSPHLNALTASCKFGGILTDYGNVNKVKNTNDLYLSSHRYDTNPAPPPPHNYGYGSSHSSQPLYASNTHQPMVHGPHDPLPTNATNYTNDLSLTINTFDNNYHSHLDNHLGSQTLAAAIQHNPQQQQQQTPPPGYAATLAKRALLDYRKPIQPQPPPTINDECYPALSNTTNTTTRDHHHYNQHDVLNTPETTTSFNEYESPQECSSYTVLETHEVMGEAPTVAASNESNKNLSLRDFIANWNDDEEEYQNNEEINFDQSSVIQEVLQATPNVQQQEAAVSMEVVTSHEMIGVVKSSPACSIETKEDNQVIDKELKATATDPAPSPTPVPGLNDSDPDNNQYANLPDIIIDIEKSNSANNSAIIPATGATLEPAAENNGCVNLTDFDVEKELDELKIKKPTQQDQTKDLNDINDHTKSVNTPQLSPCKNLSFEDLNLETNNKTVLNSLANSTVRQSSELPEHYFKDMEGYESGSSRHSNESAFEKEYETFINRISHETGIEANDKCKEIDQEVEFEQNVQDFSKFYKRKRKLKEDELKSCPAFQQNKKKLKSSMIAVKQKSSNFPQVYTKKSRNRSAKRTQIPRRRKPFSLFYKIIHSVRRIGLKRFKRARDYLTELKEKHLPLIKRQSIKNYSHCLKDSLFKPQTLKALCVEAINTEEFRQRIITPIEKEEKKLSSTCLEADSDKHICPDPTCETCEVLRSLMASEAFETPVLDPTNLPDNVQQLSGEEECQEKITVIDEELNIVDLNLKKDEYIVISTDDENLEFDQGNLQILEVTKTVPDNNSKSQLEMEATETVAQGNPYFKMSSIVSPIKLISDIAEQFEVDKESEISTTVYKINVPLAVEENKEKEDTVPDNENLVSDDHKVDEMDEIPEISVKQAINDTEKESEDSDSSESDSESSTDSTSSSSSRSRSSSSSSSSSTTSDGETSDDEDKENSVRNPDHNQMKSSVDVENENKISDPKNDKEAISTIFYKSEDSRNSDSEVEEIKTDNICHKSSVHCGNPEIKCSRENARVEQFNSSAENASKKEISTNICKENSNELNFQDPVRLLDTESSNSEYESEDDHKVNKALENFPNTTHLNTKTDVDVVISDDESKCSTESEMEKNQEELKRSDNQFLAKGKETHQEELEHIGLKDSPLKDSHESLSEDCQFSEESENSDDDVETGKNPSTNPKLMIANETKENSFKGDLGPMTPLTQLQENLSDDSLTSEEDENSDNDLEADKNNPTKATNFDQSEAMFKKETNEYTAESNLDLSMPLNDSRENVLQDCLSSEEDVHSDNDLETDKNLPLNSTQFNETLLNNTNKSEENNLKNSTCFEFAEQRSNEEDVCSVFKESSFRKADQESSDSYSENFSEDSLSSENNENSDNDIKTVKNLLTRPANSDQSEQIFTETSKSSEATKQKQHSSQDDLYPPDNETCLNEEDPKADANISEYSFSSEDIENSAIETETVKDLTLSQAHIDDWNRESSENISENFSYSEVREQCSNEEDLWAKGISLEEDDVELHETLPEVNFNLLPPVTAPHDNLSEGSMSSEESENSDSDMETCTNLPTIAVDSEKTLEDFRDFKVREQQSRKEQNYSTLNETASENENQQNAKEFNLKSMKLPQQGQVLESDEEYGNSSEEDNSDEISDQDGNQTIPKTFEADFMQHIVREYRIAQVSETIENLVSLVNSDQKPEVVLPARETLLEFSFENKSLDNPESALISDQQESCLQSLARVTGYISETPTNNKSDNSEQNFAVRDYSNETSSHYSDSSNANNFDTEYQNFSQSSSQNSESEEIKSVKEESNPVIADLDIPESFNKNLDMDSEKEIEACSQENNVIDKQLMETEIEHTEGFNKIEPIAKDDDNLNSSELVKEFLYEMEIHENQPEVKLVQKETDTESISQESKSFLVMSPKSLDKVDEENCENMNSGLEFKNDTLTPEFFKATSIQDNWIEQTCKESSIQTSILESNDSEEFDSQSEAEENHYEDPKMCKESFNCSTTEKAERDLQHLLSNCDVTEDAKPQTPKNLEEEQDTMSEDCKETQDYTSTEKYQVNSQHLLSNFYITEDSKLEEEQDTTLKDYGETQQFTSTEKSETDSKHLLLNSGVTEDSKPQSSHTENLEEEQHTTSEHYEETQHYTSIENCVQDSQPSICISNIPETQTLESLKEKIVPNIDLETKVSEEFDTKGLSADTSESCTEASMFESSIIAESSIRTEQMVSNAIESMSETMEDISVETNQNEALVNFEKLSEKSKTEIDTVSETIPEIQIDQSDFLNEVEYATDGLSLEIKEPILDVPSKEEEIPHNTLAVESISLETQKEILDVPAKSFGDKEISPTKALEEFAQETIGDNSLEIQERILDFSIGSFKGQQISRTKAEQEVTLDEIEDTQKVITEEKEVHQALTVEDPISAATKDIPVNIQKDIDKIKQESESEVLENIPLGIRERISDITMESYEEKTISQRAPEIEDLGIQKVILDRSTESEVMKIPQGTTEECDYLKKLEDFSLEIPNKISYVSAITSGDGKTPQSTTKAEAEYYEEKEIFQSTSNTKDNLETIEDSLEVQKEILDVSAEFELKAIPQTTIEAETNPDTIVVTSLEIQKEFLKASAVLSGEEEMSPSTPNTADISEKIEHISLEFQNEISGISMESEEKEFSQTTPEANDAPLRIEDLSLKIEKELSNGSGTSAAERITVETEISVNREIFQTTSDKENSAEIIKESSLMHAETSVNVPILFSTSIREFVPETSENSGLENQKVADSDSPESKLEIYPFSKSASEIEDLNDKENCAGTVSRFAKLASPEETMESLDEIFIERDVKHQALEQNYKTMCDEDLKESPLIARSSEDSTNSIEESVKLQDPTVPASTKNSEIITKECVRDSPKSAHDSKTDLKISNEKENTTEEDFSGDFYGFKNQSSFEEESEDFHGFEDLEEVARIRQEIEQLNEDSTANDGFLNYAMLNKELHKLSTTSLSAGSSGSEINELEALEKELSQHQPIVPVEEEVDDKTNETEVLHVVEGKGVSTNDIEHIKQMLESDEEAHQPDEYEKKDNNSKVKFIENSNPKDILKDIIKPVNVNSVIPKLSDLCRAALNSSLHSNRNLCDTETTSTVLVERELSVEEALAEMYRQAGVLLSDPEDCDNEAASMANEEAHDVLLINLQEILNSDNNDVYVLQCDMNEQNSTELDNSGQAERVNTVQFIGILDTQNNESPQIHIISSDSESEVIILSDDDDETDFVYRPFVAQQERITIPFINDNNSVSNDNVSLSDISTIHHEEIVPDNLNKFLQEEFYKYLHEKYVQRNISKYYHANRVMKKYRKRYVKTKRH